MIKLISTSEKVLEAIVALQLLITVLLVFSNIVLRYFFNSGIAETDEIARIFLGALIFSGATIALAQGRHIGMTLVVEKLPTSIQKVLIVFVAASMIFCDLLLVNGAWQQALINLDNYYPLSGFPSATPYFIASLCGGLMAVLTLVTALMALSNRIPLVRFFAKLSDATE